jgi:hypothetical protein
LVAKVILRRRARFFPFSIKQKLAHLWRALAKRLGRLFSGRVVSNFKPQARFVVLSKKSAIAIANRANNSPRDGRLIIFASFQVRSSMQVDEIAEIAIARMNISASPAPRKNISVVEERSAFFGGWYGVVIVLPHVIRLQQFHLWSGTFTVIAIVSWTFRIVQGILAEFTCCLFICSRERRCTFHSVFSCHLAFIWRIRILQSMRSVLNRYRVIGDHWGFSNTRIFCTTFDLGNSSFTDSQTFRLSFT